jgi:hypothetical protein
VTLLHLDEVPLARFERATCDLEDRCSIPLSYRGGAGNNRTPMVCRKPFLLYKGAPLDRRRAVTSKGDRCRERAVGEEEKHTGGSPAGDPGRWDQMPPEADPGFIDILRGQIDRDLQLSADAGVFDQPHGGRHLSRTPLILDDQGQREAAAALASTIEKMEEIQCAAATRLKGDPDDGAFSILLLLHFESPTD